MMTKDEAEVKALEVMRLGGCSDEEWLNAINALGMNGNQIVRGWMETLLQERRENPTSLPTKAEKEYMQL